MKILIRYAKLIQPVNPKGATNKNLLYFAGVCHRKKIVQRTIAIT
jgi:hypothetical protein